MIPAVSFSHITKRFPGVLALEDVSFSIAAGTCHALCGENGAGKSTLGKILAGIYQPDGGHVEVSGTRVDFSGPQQALAAGIGIVHQELAFCDNLSVAENKRHIGLWQRRDRRLGLADQCVRRRAH